MSYFAALNGDQRIVSGSISIPYYGVWCADLVLATGANIRSAATITIGNLTLSGTVYRAGSFAGAKSARIVGGGGGWRNDVAAQGYYNASGVMLSLVLNDAALQVGERVNVGTDRSVGTFYVRESAPASKVLRQLVGDVWYVDTAGVTQVAARTNSSPIKSDFTVIEWSGAKGSFQIATEDLASWMPARTFTAPTVPELQSISLTTIGVDSTGKLRLEVLSVGAANV